MELGRVGPMMMSAVAGAARYGVAGDRRAVARSGGGLYAVLSLPNFRLPRSWTLSLSAAARRTTPAASAASANSILVIAVGGDRWSSGEWGR